MTDLVKLILRAGNGGNGRVSFHREKFITKGGPDGGKGGAGGDIILRATHQLNTLSHFAGAKEFAAEPGMLGGKRKQIGKDGEDIVLEVPVGTVVWLLAENRESHKRTRVVKVDRPRRRNEFTMEKYHLPQEGASLPPRREDEIRPVKSNSKDTIGQVSLDDSPETAEPLFTQSLHNLDLKTLPKMELITLTEDGQEVILCQGGLGGRGNESFKGSTNTTPLEAEYGTLGEIKIVALELKLLADVGLVGFPNAGKSTLISRLTEARPKIANYPFTTLEPQLGVMRHKGKEIVIADIPGLIEGAHEGKGLGYTFLRHVENSAILLFVLALDETVIFDTTLSEQEKATVLWQQYQSLLNELHLYNELLQKKRSVLVINKVDVYSNELIDAIKDTFKQENRVLMQISAVTGQGLPQLQDALVEATVSKAAVE
jgi:GTP-binding protein